MFRPVYAGIVALCALATGAVAATPATLAPVGADQVPPRLSVATAAYFHGHPESYAAFMAALPRRCCAAHA